MNGVPLIGHSILSAKASSIFEKVIVSTDDSKIASVASEYNAEVFMRSPTNATDKSHMFPVYREFVTSVNYVDENDSLFVLLPTNPLRSPEDIITASKLFDDAEVEWVFSCSEMEHHPYRAVRICNDSASMQPFFPLSNDVMWSNRQELPPAYRFNGAIIAGKIRSIMNHAEYPIDSFNFLSTKVKAFLSSKYSSLDIDTQLDFNFIEFILKNLESE